MRSLDFDARCSEGWRFNNIKHCNTYYILFIDLKIHVLSGILRSNLRRIYIFEGYCIVTWFGFIRKYLLTLSDLDAFLKVLIYLSFWVTFTNDHIRDWLNVVQRLLVNNKCRCMQNNSRPNSKWCPMRFNPISLIVYCRQRWLRYCFMIRTLQHS